MHVEKASGPASSSSIRTYLSNLLVLPDQLRRNLPISSSSNENTSHPATAMPVSTALEPCSSYESTIDVGSSATDPFLSLKRRQVEESSDTKMAPNTAPPTPDSYSTASRGSHRQDYMSEASWRTKDAGSSIFRSPPDTAALLMSERELNGGHEMLDEYRWTIQRCNAFDEDDPPRPYQVGVRPYFQYEDEWDSEDHFNDDDDDDHDDDDDLSHLEEVDQGLEGDSSA